MMKKKILSAALLLVLLGLPAAVSAWDGYTADEYFYDQLDADEKAVYRALAAASPYEQTGPQEIYVPMPQNTSRYSSTDFLYTALYSYRYDHPSDAAWIDHIMFKGPDGRDIPFEQLKAGTPDRLPAYEAFILEIHPACSLSELVSMDRMIGDMTRGADREMSRYDRASYILDRVSSRLVYDGSAADSASPLCIFDSRAICEGFSKVYKIMADKLGLPCVLSGGSAHMCVQVQMEDGLWYLVEPQGSLLLVGMDQVSGSSMYVPHEGPVHFRAAEGHDAVVFPAIPQRSYRPSQPHAPVTPPPVIPVSGRNPRPMGIPRLGNRICRSGDMNMTVFWVQTQLKATGRWYQGENWDCTGNLGDHTISEIRSFMRSRGYASHSGNVDQRVIDELCAALGSRIVPVYVGGYYDRMNSIMQGGSSGNMSRINSNLIEGVPRVMTGARWIQVCLKQLGYYSGSVDGMYGEGTERAVKAFQRGYGWEERNYVTLGVARAMLEAYVDRGGDLDRLP